MNKKQAVCISDFVQLIEAARDNLFAVPINYTLLFVIAPI